MACAICLGPGVGADNSVPNAGRSSQCSIWNLWDNVSIWIGNSHGYVSTVRNWRDDGLKCNSHFCNYVCNWFDIWANCTLLMAKSQKLSARMIIRTTLSSICIQFPICIQVWYSFATTIKVTCWQHKIASLVPCLMLLLRHHGITTSKRQANPRTWRASLRNAAMIYEGAGSNSNILATCLGLVLSEANNTSKGPMQNCSSHSCVSTSRPHLFNPRHTN